MIRFRSRTTSTLDVTREHLSEVHPIAKRNRWWLARLYVTIAVGLTTVVAVAPIWLAAPHAPRRPQVIADGVLGNWLQWDGWWYVNIASHGYTYRPHHMSAVAFFPVYPLVVRAAGAILPGGIPLAAIAVTMLCGICSLALFHRWCSVRMRPRAARVAVVTLAVYPFAWFLYGAAYSDALFLALALIAFLLLESDRPVLAGLVGLIATATRPTGITLAFGLAAVVADRGGRLGGRPRTPWRVRDAGVLLSLAGLLIWCVWLWGRFRSPLAFVETEGAPGWNQAPGMHTWLKMSYVHAVASASWPVRSALVLQALACMAVIALVPAVARHFGRGYAAYVLIAVVVPALSTADFLGMGRYLLPAFPVFALSGIALEQRPRTRVVTHVGSAFMLVVGAALFGSGYLMS